MKLETIVAYMLKCLINIYLIQETWLEGSNDFTIGEITFLMHAQEKQEGRGRGGVAITLWKRTFVRKGLRCKSQATFGS
jgi:hypothetical protein